MTLLTAHALRLRPLRDMLGLLVPSAYMHGRPAALAAGALLTTSPAEMCRPVKVSVKVGLGAPSDGWSQDHAIAQRCQSALVQADDGARWSYWPSISMQST